MSGPVTIGSILSRTFSLFVAGFLPFLTISFLIHSPLLAFDSYVLLTGSLSLEMLPIVNFGSSMILTPIAAAALVYGVFQSQRGRLVTTGECIRVGLSRWPAIILLSVLVGITNVVGFMLCLIPGFIVMCGLFVAMPVLVVEEQSVIDAFQRSWNLTEGYKLTLFGVLLVLGVISFAAVSVLQLLTASLAGEHAFMVTQLGQDLINIPAATLQALAAGTAYYQIRLFREGLDEDDLAAVFD